MKREIRLTADGSPTLYVPELDETYHSRHGSVQEALHVFIANGLKPLASKNKSIQILEVGFGTGLNAFLSAQFAHEHQSSVQYTGIEAFPVEEAIWRQLSYFQKPEEKAIYYELMAASWEEPLALNSNFTLTKVKNSIQDWQPKALFDLIYFDAFGPRAQAEMWNKAIFEKLFTALNKGGVLVTYCAQGQFRRDLKAIGFEVLSLPGPPGKREMTRAYKI
ncbi:MAG: tRNA (5-methylaminomethyl-2-thiouridine)(34)-methyltransferase MnmD [Sphingomonadales bacterium]|nr:tRNA (5-methylaminomethyl-2-thiouridine)(34)-methyltransferase MnmD [Sphingomonadales bacterium]